MFGDRESGWKLLVSDLRRVLNVYWNLGLEEFRDFKGEEFKND